MMVRRLGNHYRARECDKMGFGPAPCGILLGGEIMAHCSVCGAELAGAVRFCSNCGRPASAAPISSADDVATIDFATATSPAPPRTSGSSHSSSRTSSSTSSAAEFLISEGRFLPGRVIAGRYRIIALLGKGGMGEVYRADDLTLGQAVAIKFLPDEATRDEGMRERFRSEVRIARRVSHPNVCRVYDVGEVDGQTFFTMEYVDGEDLASLLRRIGRLPQDKAVDIARQLCAGLTAAHAKSVLHRDLKPANIMLDGRGQVVITDFGLAGVADNIRGQEIRSGTPAYMAPEQLEGKEVSTRSDIYALGLVLYEVFTGKRAFAEKPVALRAGGDHTPSRPSSVVKDLDPVIEKVILRCLEADPSARPASALAVAGALPGGDPLAAALAAGETPSPQLVAAAGEAERIAPRMALAGFAAAIAGMLLVAHMALRVSGLEMMHPTLPPEALAVRAEEVIKALGYSERPVDHAAQFYFQTEFTDYVATHDLPRPNWKEVFTQPPQTLVYAYRQSPAYLEPNGYQGISITPGIVQFDDPPAIQSGMINLILDTEGRLTYFQAIPNEFEPNPPPAAAVDWKPLFTAAGLDPAQLQSAEPKWLSLAASDTRAAWTGRWPGSGRPLRVEAAAFRGKPVYFQLIGPWTTPTRMQSSNTTAGQHAGQILGAVVLILLLSSGAGLARRNYRRGSSDSQGALQLAGLVFAIEIAIWVCRDHFTPTQNTLGRFVLAMSTGLFLSGAIFILYLALEPYVRRRWPQAIVSWSRLMTGRVRDPLVGRDVLWGVLLGLVWSVIVEVGLLLLKRIGDTPDLPSTSLLLGGRQVVGVWLLNVLQCIVATVEFFFVLFLLRVVLRNKWLATVAFVALWSALNTLQGHHPEIMLPVWLAVFSIAAFAVNRFGLITFAFAVFTANVLLSLPYTLDFSLWYADSALLVLLSFVAIAAWGFYHSLGRQTVWRLEVD
jgi:predicted Ser/Thr protein kinase